MIIAFIATHYPNSPKFCEMMENAAACSKQNNVDDFENLTLIKDNRQVPNLKKVLTKAEFSQKQVGVFECPDKRPVFCPCAL